MPKVAAHRPSPSTLSLPAKLAASHLVRVLVAHDTPLEGAVVPQPVGSLMMCA